MKPDPYSEFTNFALRVCGCAAFALKGTSRAQKRSQSLKQSGLIVLWIARWENQGLARTFYRTCNRARYTLKFIYQTDI